jgi:acetyl esterase
MADGTEDATGTISRWRSSVERAGFRMLVGTPFVRSLLGGSRDERIDGRTLDPEVAAMLKLDDLTRRSDLTPLAPRDARRRVAQDILTVDLPAPETSTEDRVIPSPAGAIPTRLYVPPRLGDISPGIIYLHGGGWVTGSITTHDGLCRRLAHGAGCRVLSVGYRLAPEHPFPAAVDDCLAATRFTMEHAAELGMDPRRIAIGGDSAGGNLSAVVSLRTKNDARRPSLQVLLYPALDLTCSTGSYETFKEGYFLTRAMVDWYVAHYLGGHDARDPDVSPLFSPDVSDVPALVYTAGFDVLRDEGKAYAERLEHAGTRVAYSELPHLVHGFACMTAVKSALQATNDIARDIGGELSKPPVG